MEISKEELKGGWMWLFFAGSVAIGLSLFLYYVDTALTNSDSEERLAETLTELRTAQANVSSGVADYRQISAE